MFTIHYLPILISQLSAIPPALIGIFRYKKISPVYYPFVYFCWAGLAAEIISLTSTFVYHTNAVGSNIYVLVEYLLILWQFKNWRLFQKGTRYFELCLVLVPLIWVTDIAIVHPITRFSSVYRMIYSLLIVLFSINSINELFFVERRNILRNSRFLISLAFLVYFTFKGLFEIYFLFHMQQMKTLYHLSLIAIDVVNDLANFTFALALLWIPKKDAFFTP